MINPIMKKEYKFKKYKLTHDEKLWLTELSNHIFEKIDPRTLIIRLHNKISNEFDPTKIDHRLVNSNRITLLGLWLIDPENNLITETHFVIDKIRVFLRSNPELGSIDSHSISHSLDIPESNVKIIFYFLFDLGFCNGGSTRPGENHYYMI